MREDETCKNGKRSKERITVLFCSSATGEKFKLLVIGHAENRVFKQNNVQYMNLPTSNYTVKYSIYRYLYRNSAKLINYSTCTVYPKTIRNTVQYDMHCNEEGEWQSTQLLV